MEMIDGKKQNFAQKLSERLSQVCIECRDAVELIGKTDTADTFFDIDPPYVGANQMHYDGYMQAF